MLPLLSTCIFNTHFILVLIVIELLGTAICNFQFPKDFQFGVATSSYQIEGGWNASGKGENVWDRITHQYPDWVIDRSNGDVACNSYHLWKTDVKLIKNLNVNFYRFSLSWSRLLPNGLANYINPDGVRYYNNIINELLRNNIQSMVTLYHWDLPQHLQDLGGWPNPLLAKYFEEYAKIAFELFGDRVKTWITFNEPSDVCEWAYGEGISAPAIISSGVGNYLCAHTMLIAHARAYHVYNKYFRFTQKGKVGITSNAFWYEPKTNSTRDVEAAQRAMQMNFGWLMHPIFSNTGDYPSIMKNRIDYLSKVENFSFSRLPQLAKSDVAYIQGTSDFLGLNHYTTYLTSDIYIPVDAPLSHFKDVSINIEADPKWKKSAVEWLKDVAWGFRRILNWIKNEYANPPVYVTENGFADLGELDDIERIEYYKCYLNALLDAIYLDKCNVQRYTAWSLMDSMEWRRGYTIKFGLYHVNFSNPNRQRTPKTSASFYRCVIETKTTSKCNKFLYLNNTNH